MGKYFKTNTLLQQDIGVERQIPPKIQSNPNLRVEFKILLGIT